ncbi:MAG: hypothetical protein KF709_12665 [Gemmatimonadaceae bacterium]|nr:hypothetical protein [Gemmatimonadaceae bacterium]
MGTHPTTEQAQSWMRQWRAAAPALARVRAAELATVDVVVVAEELEGALDARMRMEPPPPSSGLVEQQRVFARARRG